MAHFEQPAIVVRCKQRERDFVDPLEPAVFQHRVWAHPAIDCALGAAHAFAYHQGLSTGRMNCGRFGRF
jgi:hypothetical protein